MLKCVLDKFWHSWKFNCTVNLGYTKHQFIEKYSIFQFFDKIYYLQHKVTLILTNKISLVFII